MEKKKQTGTAMRLRNYFLTGLVVSAPLVITVYLIWSIMLWIDSWVKPYLPDVYNPDTYLPFTVPGFGLFVVFFLITMIGFLTANYIGSTLVSYGENLLSRMPVVRSIYSGLKKIFQTVFVDKSDTFKSAGIIEYPRSGIYAIVFVAIETQGEVAEFLKSKNEETISVFLPTTPNPTSGFLLFVPKNEITILNMKVEDAAKLVISAGLVTPEYQAVCKKLLNQKL